jgi:hypothetical protein
MTMKRLALAFVTTATLAAAVPAASAAPPADPNLWLEQVDGA